MSNKTLAPLGAELANTFRDLNRFLREVGFYLLIAILASGGAFIFQNLIAVDDWWAYANSAQWQSTGPIAMGRPIFSVLTWLSFGGFPIHPLDTVLLYVALTVFAFTIFRRWSESSWFRLLLVLLFITSPFLVEHLHFNINQIPLSVALLLLSFWFVTITREARASLPVIAAGSLAAALAIATRHELLFLAIGTALIELSREAMTDVATARRRLLPVTGSILLAVLLAVVVIVAFVFGTGLGFESEGNYGTGGLVRDPEAFLRVLGRFFTFWRLFLFEEHYLFPTLTKVLVWIVAASALLQCFLMKDYRRLAIIVTVGLLLSALPLSFGLVSNGFPYLYAGVFPLALYACFLTCVALSGNTNHKVLRASAAVSAVLVIAISAANLSAVQVRMSNMNRRDFSTITQFLGAIRATYVQDWKVAMLGSYPKDIGIDWSRGQGWAWSREHCSVFSCMQELPALLILTLLERNPNARIFQLTDADKAKLQPQVDSLPEGSATMVRLDETHFVILLK